jgi:hypothetical protein
MKIHLNQDAKNRKNTVKNREKTHGRRKTHGKTNI